MGRVSSLVLILAVGCGDTADGGDGGTDGQSSGGVTGQPGTGGNGSGDGDGGSTSSSGSGADGSGGDPSGTSGGAETTGTGTDGGGDPNECTNWQAEHPEWIFCDDYESDDPLVGDGRYFEASGPEDGFTREEGLGYLGSAGLQGHWQVGQVGAGGVKLAFGRNPNGYMNTGIRPGVDFREIWYRMMLKNEAGWEGSPAKLSRATVFTSADDWSQAMIAHLWSDDDEHLLVDPASCVQGSSVQCTGYNDFDNLDWLGFLAGTTRIFATANADRWSCVEAHVRLDDPGQANGVHEFWIDGNLEARRDGLAFVKDYSGFAINAVFLENYWNDGSGREQKRWFDNFVVSTAPIGCP